ncbi:hypothetical protein SLS53_002687 [Cytospora paraplurivora]|uniref:Uncharacterized protein n=1 Tax=Cytospora paraplurivora TaxID=2898453 RepID=A0AAN9YKA2_9PEZI
MLPFFEVSHLPSSTSFYSAASQPLGLRYISAANSGGSQSITYGLATSPSVPVFELRQVRPTVGRPLKLSRIVFSAPSPEAVRDFQALARKVREEDRKSAQFGDQRPSRYAPETEKPLLGVAAGRARTGHDSEKLPDKARETDIDGNIMEVAYVPPSEYGERYGGSTIRKTQSTQGQVSRILNWNYDVASSESSLASPRRPGRFSDDEQASAPRRSVTHTSSTMYEPAGLNSSGLLGPGALGTLIGVAAGAAIGAGLTYGVMKGGPQEAEVPTYHRTTTTTTLPEPHQEGRGRRSEHDRPAKELQYRDDYTIVADRRPPPTILTRYTHAPAPLGRGREVDDAHDGRSRHPSRSKPAALPSTRARSEASTSRKPLLLAEVEHRSYVTPKHSDLEDVSQDQRGPVVSRQSSRSKRSVMEPQSIRRSKTYHVGAGGDRYIPARSYGTTSTSRGPPPADNQAELVSRPAPKPTSRGPAATLPDKPRRSNSYASAREVPLTRTASYRSSRDVPPPASRTGMSYVPARHVPQSSGGLGAHHTPQWEDDVDSIAPSDSISCVGARRSERAYR